MNRTNKTLGTLLLAAMPLIGCGRTEYILDPEATIEATCTMDRHSRKYKRFTLRCGEEGDFHMRNRKYYFAFKEDQRVHVTIARGTAIHYDSEDKEVSREPYAKVVDIRP